MEFNAGHIVIRYGGSQQADASRIGLVLQFLKHLGSNACASIASFNKIQKLCGMAECAWAGKCLERTETGNNAIIGCCRIGLYNAVATCKTVKMLRSNRLIAESCRRIFNIIIKNSYYIIAVAFIQRNQLNIQYLCLQTDCSAEYAIYSRAQFLTLASINDSFSTTPMRF